MIRLLNIYKEFDGKDNRVQALRNLNLSIKEEEFVSIIGPSGCGKTSILKIMAGLLKPTKGSINFNGNNIDNNATKDTSIVFQNPVLLPWKNILENVALPRKLNGNNDIKDVLKNIELVGLKGFETSYPNELSGGMQQRVSIARTMTTNSKIMLMDKPFGALDEINRDTLNNELLKIYRKIKPTVLFVTHSIREAVFLSDRVVILTKRPATVKRIIKINLPRPRNVNLKESVKFQEYVKCIRKEIE